MRFAALVLPMMALAGCAVGQTSISRVEIGNRYEPTEQGYLGGKDAILPTAIWNNPLPEAAANWRGILTQYRPGTPLSFVPLNEVAEDRQRHRFVLLFAPPVTMTDLSICALTSAPPAVEEGQGPYRWRAAYCVGDRTINEAVGQLATKPAAGADSMAPVLPELALSLFPLVNPHLKNERCLVPTC